MKPSVDPNQQRNRVRISEPDEFFDAIQIARLAELMQRWGIAIDCGSSLSKAEKEELQALVHQEFEAGIARTEMHAKKIRDVIPDLPSFFAEVRRLPGMCLGANDIRYLGQQLDGIQFAEDFHKIEPQHRIGGFDFRTFEAWVTAKHNPKQLTLKSFGLAEYIAGSREAGFDLWFDWYDAFRAEDRPGSKLPG